jgi:branched-chain amino acid transport system substrate-binding protein
MLSRAAIRTVGAMSVVALVLVACGQHPGVHVEGSAAPGDDGIDDGGGVSAAPDADGLESPDEVEGGLPDAPELDGQDPQGNGSAGSGEGGDSPGGEGSQTGDSGGGDGQQAPSDDGEDGEAQAQAQQREPQGSDRTGVSDDTLTLGIHAPVTGAAPLPSEAFEEAGDLYWRWITEEQGESVLGRDDVEVVFADDRFEPATARQICRELAERVFLLVGGGGTDQIQACGSLAIQTQILYFSPGVTEAGLEDNPWYFPASMTYRQQGGLLAELVSSRFGNAKTAAVVLQTPNFDDAVQGWEQGVEAEGVDYHQTLRNPRNQTGWYADFANQLGDAGVEVVYVNMSPLDYIRFAQVAADQGHEFQFVGVGVTQGLNPVLSNGCPQVDNGIFFSPFPALEVIDDIDPQFRRAANAFGVEASDLALAIWGLQKSQHELFKLYEQTFGTDLTREDFRAVVADAGTVEGGVFPPVNYRSDVDFGGQGVHVLEADCSAGEYRDGGTFQSGF